MMGSQHGYQSEAEIPSSRYARNILIMQIESLLRERKEDTISLWDKGSKCVKILLLEEEVILRGWPIFAIYWVTVFCTQ